MPNERYYWKTTKSRQYLPMPPVRVSSLSGISGKDDSVSPTPPLNDGLVVEPSYFGAVVDANRVESPTECPTVSTPGPSQRRGILLSIQVPNDTLGNPNCPASSCCHPETSNTTATIEAPIPTVRVIPTSPAPVRSTTVPSPTKCKVASSSSSPLSVETTSGSLSLSGMWKSPSWSFRMRMASGRRATSLDSRHDEADQFSEKPPPLQTRPRSLCSSRKSVVSQKGAEPRISESAEFMDVDENETESQTLDSPMILISSTSSPTVTEKSNYCDGVKDDDDTRHVSASPTFSLLEFPGDSSGAESLLEDPPSSSKAVRSRAWYVMAEIMDTERAYVADLRTLYDVYLVEFMRDNGLGLAQEQRESVALNVPVLLNVHEPFLRSLEAIAKEFGINGNVDEVDVNESMTEKQAIDAIALCFLKVVPQFGELYQTFCSGHTEAAAIIRNIQHTSAFVAFEKTCASMAANPSSLHSSPLTFPREEDAEDKHVSLSPIRQSNNTTPTTTTNDSPPSKPSSKSSLSKRASSKSLKRLSFTLSSSSPSKSAPPSPSTKTQVFSSSLSSSRTPASMRWRRSSPELPVRTEISSDTPEANDVPPVPPVPPLTPPGSPLLPGATASPPKRLAFRDLLIKPVQRVCRYPLLLEQILPAPVPNDETPWTGSIPEDLLLKALIATKKLAQDVDTAREKRDVEIKTRLIVDRLDATSTLSTDFVSSLGSVRLASSLDMIYHHPFLAPLYGVVKVRYCGAFVYDGYLLLVKVRKNKNILPLHWLPLGNVEVVNDDEGRGLLPHSFKVKVEGHTLELGAACSGEKDLWLRTLATSCTIPFRADNFVQRSSLQIMEDQHAPPIESGTGASRKRRQSLLGSAMFSVSSSNSAPQATPSALVSAASQKVLGLAGSSTVPPMALDVESTLVLAESGTSSRMERQWTIKRSSIGRRSSLFSLESSSTTYRRVAAAERLMVDRTLTEMWSSECITIRTQAQFRGELFSQIKASAQEPFDKGSWSKASFPRRSLTLVTEGSSVSAAYTPVRRQSAPPSPPHRRETWSIPRNSSEPDKLASHLSIRKGTILRDPDSPGRTASLQEMSDDDNEAFWDDVLSSTHTDPTSEEMQDVRDGRLHKKAKSHPDQVHVPEYELSYLGEGIANQPLPRQQSSFLLRSLTAVTRRRTKSTPSMVPYFLTENGSCKSLQTASNLDASSPSGRDNDTLLSPYWTKAAIVARSASSVHFEPSPVVSPFLNTTHSPLPPPQDTPGQSRSAIDLCRLEPDLTVDGTVRRTTISSSSSSSTTSQSARSLRSLFQYRNKFTSLS